MALFQLGESITFEAATVTPQTVSRQKSWRWAVQERILRGPARQRIGVGDDVVTFSGVIFPQFQVGGKAIGRKQLEKIEAEGDKMDPMLLNDGTGKIWGMYCMLDLSEDRDVFLNNGAPRKQTFTLTLGKYFEDSPAMTGVDIPTNGVGNNVA